MDTVKPYKKDFDYSYTLGAFPTIEMIKTRPEIVRRVFIHETFPEKGHVEGLCAANNIPVLHGNKPFQRISPKENCYVLGVFEKYTCVLAEDKPHVVLVNPGDMGNLGTIIRTMLGFNMFNLAIVTPSADIFNPKTVRASMGAVFRTSFQHFPSFEQYAGAYGKHSMFPFILSGGTDLRDCPKTDLFSLVFGNEAAGLPESFTRIGTGVRIPQSDCVDSLNLSVAVGIGIYMFAGKDAALNLS